MSKEQGDALLALAERLQVTPAEVMRQALARTLREAETVESEA